MAQAMTWVNDAFDCPISVRWLLTTRLFSSSTLTGMLRTDVAVGTASEASMFWAIFPAAPRRTTTVWSVEGGGAGTGVGREIGAPAAAPAGPPAARRPG